jgi:hypothetical protein
VFILDSESKNQASSSTEIGTLSKTKICCFSLNSSKILVVLFFEIHKKFELLDFSLFEDILPELFKLSQEIAKILSIKKMESTIIDINLFVLLIIIIKKNKTKSCYQCSISF